ncbi:MAG: hypothetical protein ACYTKC_05945 [Planctomycetota bacterium]|jgi:hypothetical protein
MVLIATTLVLGLCQAPQASPQEPRTKAPQDVIILKAGERLAGRIVKETPDYIEVRMGVGTVVGFDKSRVLRITRAAASKSGAAPKPALADQDAWFVLHNGRGELVGHLHSAVVTTDDGNFRIGEEWHFRRQTGTTDITLVEVIDDQLHPRSCFYHERSFRGPGGRLATERLVHGVVRGDRFVVQRRTLSGHEKTSYQFKDGLKFPLSLVEELRQRPGISMQGTRYSLFDPRTDEFMSCDVSTKTRRKVEWKGRQIHVREITTKTSLGSNVEWLDAANDTIRREINGQALVAVRSTREVVQGQRMGAKAGFTSALVTNTKAGLALWLPNPTWRPLPASRSQVRIEAPLYGATAVLTELDQIDAGLELDSAADAVLRWLKLSLGERLRVVQRSTEQVRGRPAVRIDATYRVAQTGKVEHFRARVHVFRVRGHYLALCCTAPRALHRQLETDYQRICRSVQLSRDDFVPTVQGPVKRN